MLYALNDLYEFGYTTYKDLMKTSTLSIADHTLSEAAATVSITASYNVLFHYVRIYPHRRLNLIYPIRKSNY